MDDEAPEEVKSLVSSMDSQKVSRTETPIENIPRSPSPKFPLPAPESPVTLSSEHEESSTQGDGEQPVGDNEVARFQTGEVFDPRISVALAKIASLQEALEKNEAKLENVEEREVNIRKKMELLELVKNCPTEVKKTLRKEMVENINQVTNMVKSLEMKLDESVKNSKSLKSNRMDLASDEMADWFKAKFKAELGYFESKNKVKGWIQSDLNAYQVINFQCLK